MLRVAYFSFSELTSAAMAYSMASTTWVPPPIKRKRELVIRIYGFLRTADWKTPSKNGPERGPRAMPIEASRIVGLRPILSASMPKGNVESRPIQMSE